MEKLVSMKKLVSLGLVFVLAAVFAISAFAAPADAEEIVHLSRGSYYLTSGYTTIASVSTGLGTSSIEVYNLAENGAGIWVRIGSNEQGIHMGGSAGWTVGYGTHTVQAKIADGPAGSYALEINVAT